MSNHEDSLRVAMSGDYPPFSLETSDGYIGFDVDLTQYIASTLGLGVEFKGFGWSQFDALLSVCSQPNPPIDIVASGVTITDERRHFGFFSRPYLRMKALIIGPKVADSTQDLMAAPKVIGVNQGGYLERLARQKLAEHRIICTKDNRKLASMINDSVECVLTDSLEAAVIQRKLDLQIWRELDSQEIGLFLPKCNLQLAAEVDAIIGAALKNGTLAGFANRHRIPVEMLCEP